MAFRFNCFSRKSVAADESPVPARPVLEIPHRPKHGHASIKPYPRPNIAPVPRIPLDLQPPLEPPRNAMDNAAGQRAGGRNPPRNYIDLVSDSDDGNDLVDMREPALRNLVPQYNNAVQAAPIRYDLPEAAPILPGQVQPNSDFGAFMLDGGDDLDVNDPILAEYMMEAFHQQQQQDEMAAQASHPARQPSPDQQYQEQPVPLVDARIYCIDQVILVFPDICRDHVSDLYTTISKSAEFLIAHILDAVDRGTQYPKAKDTQNKLKRKRTVDEDAEAVKKYGSADRMIPEGPGGLRQFIRSLMSKDFPETPMTFLDTALKNSGYRLFSTYRVLEEAHRTFDARRPPYNKIKFARKMEDQFKDANLEDTIQEWAQNPHMIERVEVLKELQAARRIRRKLEAKRLEEILDEIEEQKNLRKAEAEGTMSECGCCFGDYPLNRMVHCDNEILHFFCRTCAKQNADTEIGNSKYELRCMSMDGCTAGFPIDQRNQFLDGSTIIALERNEQEAVLRMAGIENLESCPFCPFAAEYPPVEIDREFRCQAPDCEKTSCRICKLESHIPKSCEEHAKDQGLSVRRQIEEAMSAALIRKCNKCGTPFVKEEGCNKMTCTRNGCMNVQCYVCSKSCQYDHFDDTRRGGKTGNCPLFESVEDRHDTEVKKAERDALEKVRLEHPEYSEDDLKVKMSENVRNDDERRKANDPRNNRVIAAGMNGIPGVVFHRVQQRQYVRPPGMQPPVPVGAGGGVLYPAVPQYAQGLFADVNFQGDIDAGVFAGLWDHLPGLGPELGQAGVEPLRPPPVPYAIGIRDWHRAPAPAAVPLPLAAQVGLAPWANQFHAAPVALPFGFIAEPAQAGGQPIPNIPRRPPVPPAFGMLRAGGQLMPDIPRQPPGPPAFGDALPPQPPAAMNPNEGLQRTRDRLGGLRQNAGDIQIRRQRNLPAQGLMHQAQRIGLQADALLWPQPPNDAGQGAAMAEVRGQTGRTRQAGRGGAFNPPGGRA